mmetsp:Transcript_10073/g.16577  ORF Transcript_10073/g.16577 Transcript_10073/m.16577 type:complete len:493 (+) Transcript_10073:100-1578(+)|eukprot:scaffold3408_cov154-Skeletonema_menzelii.AAC.2
MCNTTVRLPNQVVSAPFRRLNSKNYLKDAASTQQPVKSQPSFESVPTPTHSATTVSNGDVPKKPMRPLTAYHIYFQIEREFIIQTLSGEDADKSILEGKKCLDDVPDRYRATKLSPDWYFGPGKRAKRKHRKQHGKIGFLELSRVISTRWAKLEETDPDIKQFVSKLAKQELEVYQREVEEYKELTKNMTPSSAPTKTAAKKCKKRKQSEQSQQQEVAPAASMTMMMPQHQMMGSQPTPEMIASFQRTFYGASQPIEDNSFMNNSVQLRQEIDQLKNEIEYVNSCINKYSHHFNGQPTPTFTQTNSSAPPKKQFYRRQSSNISISIFDSVMDEKAKNEPKTKKAKKSFYRRQSSDMSLSFLDSIMDEMGKNKKSKKSFYRRQSSNKSLYRRQSSGISLSFLDSVMDEMGKNEPKKAKSSSAPKKNFYRRQSSTLSLSFLDPIADKLDKHETIAPVGATPAVKKEISDDPSPVNVADIHDDDIMSLWVAQNNL